ncbi:hypothetical protein BCR39DRAFT_564865 [Naematelia encephala]|uniref:Geranylgeranyl transferase type-2 subunit alpha n=1 Tax=Naematelia encephala TaxID=71784 RepID=A0A1Y2B7E1_9TREE|nr:hypothetical protein BCR39DRAFT_564865 [Naematelia encephala]
MHGIKRSRLSAQAEEAKRIKEQAKIEAYVGLQDDVLARKRSKDYTTEALKKTTDLLDLNPEFYTIWNYRRHIFLRGLFPNTNLQGIVKLLSTDLRLTMAYLQVHPKVYWIWNHRKWCLENCPDGPEGTEGWKNEFWKMELLVVEKLLDSDARNFHAWAYRRYILASLPKSYTPQRSAQDELRYTRKKIESNFSNFSAWHCRTKILAGVWEGLSEAQVQSQKDQEFELVRQALWTDPEDQSGWLYHRWLIGSQPPEPTLRRELESIKELNEAEPDSKWCLNALAHYLLLFAGSPWTETEEADNARKEAKEILRRLAEIDSDRKERYQDLGKPPQVIRAVLMILSFSTIIKLC